MFFASKFLHFSWPFNFFNDLNFEPEHSFIYFLGYTTYRKFCGFTVPSSWENKPEEISQDNWDKLKLVYSKVEDIDAFTGGISEDSITDGVVGRVFQA